MSNAADTSAHEPPETRGRCLVCAAEWDDGNGLYMRVSYMRGLECGLVPWCIPKDYSRPPKLLNETTEK